MIAVYVAPLAGMALASSAGPSVLVAEAEAHEQVAKELAARADAMARELGISVTFVAAHGDPFNEIVRVAKETRADAIVVGASLKAGSPAHGLARGSPGPRRQMAGHRRPLERIRETHA